MALSVNAMNGGCSVWNLFVEPYRAGAINLHMAFSCGYEEGKAPTLCGRVAYGVVGVLLLVPIVNSFVMAILLGIHASDEEEVSGTRLGGFNPSDLTQAERGLFIDLLKQHFKIQHNETAARYVPEEGNFCQGMVDKLLEPSLFAGAGKEAQDQQFAQFLALADALAGLPVPQGAAPNVYLLQAKRLVERAFVQRYAEGDREDAVEATRNALQNAMLKGLVRLDPLE